MKFFLIAMLGIGIFSAHASAECLSKVKMPDPKNRCAQATSAEACRSDAYKNTCLWSEPKEFECLGLSRDAASNACYSMTTEAACTSATDQADCTWVEVEAGQCSGRLGTNRDLRSIKCANYTRKRECMNPADDADCVWRASNQNTPTAPAGGTASPSQPGRSH